jgi:hypothetical protein
MKLSRFLLAVAAVFGLASCLEIKSTVIVNKDGTATVEETALLGAQLAAMMAQGGGAGGPGDQLKGLVLDKEKAEARAKQLGEGVTVKSVEEVTVDGKTGSKVTFAVADITKLKYKPNTPEEKKDGKTTEPTVFTLEGSKLTITNPEADKKQGRRHAEAQEVRSRDRPDEGADRHDEADVCRHAHHRRGEVRQRDRQHQRLPPER